MSSNIVGKMNRGLSVVETALLLSSGSIDDAQLKSFIALGWCIEWVALFVCQSSYCMYV